jgi:dihydropteroate synthase
VAIPARVMTWKILNSQFIFPRPALIMGILNVTPDSFSDGGQFVSPAAAVARGMALAEQGADILDIGGESTRPGAEPVAESEEFGRVLPVVAALAPAVKIPISIDTTKVGVARAALNAGASIVNDVFSGARADPAMWRLVAETGAGYVLMHIQGTPATMQRQPHYENVIEEVNALLGERLKLLQDHGINPDQIALDVGIGFGKGLEHNLQLLAEWRQFRKWKRPLLLGVSRKSFLSRVAGGEAEARLAPSLACAGWAVGQGVEIIRCHDVAETRQAVRLVEAIQERRKDAKYN